MEQLTKLKIDQFKELNLHKRDEEWKQQKIRLAPLGRLRSGHHVIEYLGIGCDYIEQMLKVFFEAENDGNPSFNEDYFNELSSDLVQLINVECNSLLTLANANFKTKDNSLEKTISSEVENRCHHIREVALKEVEILREKNKLTASKPEKIEIDKEIEIPDFDFIKLKELIPILQRDYEEIIKSIKSECWKSAIILCGSAIEGILFDLLKQDESNAMSSKHAQKDKQGNVIPLDEWGLTALINTASSLNLISKGIKGLSHTIKEFRNLIHPTKEIAGEYTLKKEEADSAFAILNILIRDSS